MSGGFGSRLNSLSPLVRYLISTIYPPAPFINVISNVERKNIKNEIFSRKVILDIGSGISKGPGKWLWKDVDRERYKKLDIIHGDDIDIVASALDMPFGNCEVDAVILQSVPEHIEDITALFSEVQRVISKGGIVYVEMPFLQGQHGDPNDYWRCTPAGMNFLLGDDFTLLSGGVSAGPIGSLIWIISDLLSNILPFTILNIIIRFMIRWLLSPFRYVDTLLLNTRASKRLAAENYFLYQKK